MRPENFEGKQMFSKIILVAAALLLASPNDDASAATKKKKKAPIENSQPSTRGTSSMMRSDSYRGRVTQGRLPTPRGSTSAAARGAGGISAASMSAARGTTAASMPAAGGSTALTLGSTGNSESTRQCAGCARVGDSAPGGNPALGGKPPLRPAP